MDTLAKQFSDFCKLKLDLTGKLNYNYRSLSVCIIDCVYSLRVRYESITKPIVRRYAKHYLKGDINFDGETVSDLIKHIEDCGGTEAFSDKIVCDHHKLGGRLKADVCLTLAKYLKALHIETIDDFRNFESQELLEIVVHAVHGMGDAGTNYLFMLAGDPNRCKPDIWIHRCIQEACGRDLSNDDCQILFAKAVEILNKDYPDLTVRTLDNIIWNEYSKKRK